MSNGIVKSDPDKVKTIQEFKKPVNVKELRSFLGLANYFREFFAQFAEKTLRLNLMLRGKKKNSKEQIDERRAIKRILNLQKRDSLNYISITT